LGTTQVIDQFYERSVTAATFDSEGGHIALANSDGLVRLWSWRVEELAQAACALTWRNLTFREWEKWLEDEPYRVTCKNLPAADVDAWFASARRLSEAGELDKSLQHFEQVAKAEPFRTDAWAGVVQTAGKLERFDIVADALRNVRDSSPSMDLRTAFGADLLEQATAQLCTRSEGMLASGQIDDAIRELDLAHSINPAGAISARLLAAARVAKGLAIPGLPKNALNEFQTATRIDPESANAWFGLATAYRDLAGLSGRVSHFADAVTAIRKAFQLSPDMHGIRDALIEMLSTYSTRVDPANEPDLHDQILAELTNARNAAVGDNE
jgi:tetratricopeptide (TPR) repeat protein